MVSVYHVIFQDYLKKVSCNFMRRNPAWYVKVVSRLVAIDTLVVQI